MRLRPPCRANLLLLLCAAWCGAVQASDLVEAAAEGELWSKNRSALALSVLKDAKYREIDEKTDRFRGSRNLTVAGIIPPDVTLQWADEKREHVAGFTTTLYNKGDNGPLEKAEYDAAVKESIQNISQVMKMEPKARRIEKKDAGVKPKAWVWANDRCAVMLEAHSTGAGKRFVSEFIRVTVKPDAAGLERGGADDAAKRADLKDHVRTDREGTVWIDGIPMVDQGEKGYCVPAALSRVFAYYGMDGVDQHALASICKSNGEEGTSLEAMNKALVTISGRFHMGVTSWRWMNRKTMAKELSKLAQKRRIPEEMVTPEMLLELIEGKSALLRKGVKDISKYIDAGIPIVWGVMLGMFPEQGLPQSMGGHMRMIIGYNEAKQMIIYTDSWGAGHDLKAMPLAQACAITQVMYVLRPLR